VGAGGDDRLAVRRRFEHGSHAGAGVLVPGKTGILLDDPTPAALADALRELIGDPELRARLGAAAAAHAQKRFDPVRNARAVERVYEDLLGIASEEEPAPERPAMAVAA
jgi:hypothetical protein